MKPDGNQKKKRGPGRPFAKGNPGGPGRPKVPQEVRDAARAHTMEALETLAGVMRGGVKDADRVRAAEVLLNRAWGTPASAVEVKDVTPGASSKHTRSELIALGFGALEVLSKETP